MKNTFLIILLIFTLFGCNKRVDNSNKNIITSDITNFWEAYDKIISTQDSILQYKYLDSLYFQKGTVGLERIRQVRNYTPEGYINSINNYPKFWASIRKNTLQVEKIASELESGVEKLKPLYPELKPAKIYFSIGSFRTPGTTILGQKKVFR